MASLQSAENWIASAKGDLLVLLQEGDEGAGLPPGEWADHLFRAYELLTEALQEVDRARLYA